MYRGSVAHRRFRLYRRLFIKAVGKFSMVLNLKQLFKAEGEKRPVSYELPNTVEKLWKGHPAASPIQVRGTFFNRTGLVELEYTAEFLLRASCDRCLKEMEKQCAYRFSHHLIDRLEEDGNDDYIVLEPDGSLDMDALVSSDISLELPTKFLCRDDCKGLCPQCGKDLNEGPCRCEGKETDPRFAKLAELLRDAQDEQD